MKNIKVISLVLVMVMLICCFSACGSTAEPAATEGTTETATTEKPAEYAAPELVTTNDHSNLDAIVPHSGEAKAEYPDLRVKTADTIVVGYMHQTLDSETIKRQTRQVQIECDHRGWNLQEGIYDGQNSSTIRDTFQNLMTQDVDCILVYNTDPQSYMDLVVECRNNGVGVYNIDSQLTEGIVANSCCPNGVASANLAYMLGEMYLWEANVAFVCIPAYQVHMERSEIPIAIFNQYPTMNVVGYETISLGSGVDSASQCYDYCSRFLEMFGEDLDIIFGSWDGVANQAANVAEATGNTHLIAVGVDGGSEAFANIRKNGTFYATYAQACEAYSHSICELVDQLQVQGLKPGDAGCDIADFGQTIYNNGTIVTPDNVPDAGQPIHACQSYYDPSVADAWYMWDDGQGQYMIE